MFPFMLLQKTPKNRLNQSLQLRRNCCEIMALPRTRPYSQLDRASGFELADASLLSAASGVAYAEPRGATSPMNWTEVWLKFWLIETLWTLRSSERRVAARDDLQ